MKKMNALIILALALIFALPFAAKAEAAGAITSVKFLYADGESFKAADGYGEHEIELELLFTLGQKAKNFEAVFETSFLINPAAEVAAAELQNGDGSRAAGLSPKALSASYAFANGFEIVFPPGLELEAGDYIIPITIKCDLEAPEGEVMTAFKVNIRKLSCEQAEKTAGGVKVHFANNYSKIASTTSANRETSLQYIVSNGEIGETGRASIPVAGLSLKFYFQARTDLPAGEFKIGLNKLMINGATIAKGAWYVTNDMGKPADWEGWNFSVSRLDRILVREDDPTKTADHVLIATLTDDFNMGINSGQYLNLGINVHYLDAVSNQEIDFVDDWDKSYSYFNAEDLSAENEFYKDGVDYAHKDYEHVDVSTSSGGNNDGGSGGSGGTNSFEPAGDSGIAYLVDAISDPADTDKNTVPMNPLLISIDLSSHLRAYGSLSEPYLHQLEVDITEEGGGDFYTWFMPGALPTAGTSTESLIKIMDSSGSDITSGYTDMDMSSFAIRSGETTPPLGDSDGDGTDDLDISALPGIGDSFYERFDFMIYPVWTEHDVENNAERKFKVTISAVLINSQIIMVDEKPVKVYSQEDVSILTKKDAVRVEVFKTVQ